MGDELRRKKRLRSAWELVWDIRATRPRGDTVFGGIGWDPERRVAWFGRHQLPADTNLGVFEISELAVSASGSCTSHHHSFWNGSEEVGGPVLEHRSCSPHQTPSRSSELRKGCSATRHSENIVEEEKKGDSSSSIVSSMTAAVVNETLKTQSSDQITEWQHGEDSETACEQKYEKLALYAPRRDTDESERSFGVLSGHGQSTSPPQNDAGFTTPSKATGESREVKKAPSNSQETSTSADAPAALVAFTTGRGKKVDIDPSHVLLGRSILSGITTRLKKEKKFSPSPHSVDKNPADPLKERKDTGKFANGSPLTAGTSCCGFTTGKGKTVKVPKKTLSANLPFFPGTSPITPEIGLGFGGQPFKTPTRRTGGPSKDRNPSSVRKVLSHDFENTPFRAPRRTPPPKTLSNPVIPQLPQKNVGPATVPKLSRKLKIPMIPFLTLDGKHLYPSDGIPFRKVFPCFVPRTLQSCRDGIVVGEHSYADCRYLFTGGPKAGAEYSFSQDRAGDDTIITYIRESLEHDQTITLGLDCILRWTRSLFPGTSDRPATCVGSDAWTRLAYGLAVWKLARLETHFTERRKNSQFLTLANVVREILRRIQYEWNEVKVPPLLEILRRDASACSHIRVVIADRYFSNMHSYVIVTDGWYLAGVRVPRGIQSKLCIGDIVHIAGARLISSPPDKIIGSWFGDGDEMDSNCMDVGLYNIRKVKAGTKFTRLGRQRGPMHIKRLIGVKENFELRDTIPCVDVVLQRLYPVRYLEMKSKEDSSSAIFRREDSEARARERYEYELQEIRRSGAESCPNGQDTEDMCDFPERQVSKIVEFLVTGVHDKPDTQRAWGTVTVWRPMDDLLGILKEGAKLRLHQLSLQHRRLGLQSYTAIGPIEPVSYKENHCACRMLPRAPVSIVSLGSVALSPSRTFDGAFTIIHVDDATNQGNLARRLVYLADDPTNLKILAVELTGDDAEDLPNILSNAAKKSESVLTCCVRDLTFEGFNKSVGIFQAVSVNRAEFVGIPAAIARGKKCKDWKKLGESGQQVQDAWSDNKAAAELYRDSIVAVIEGDSKSVDAFVFGTQISQQESQYGK